MAHGLPSASSPRSIRATLVRCGVLAGLAVTLWPFLALTAARHDFFDLRVYHGALTNWVGGGSLYDYAVPDSVFGFTYPPFAAIVLSPLAFVPWPAALAIMMSTTVACTVGVAYLLVGPVARRRGWHRWYVVALAVVIAPALEPFMETLLFGQINMILVLLVTADLLLLVHRGNRWGGVGIGLASAIKLTPGVFIVYLLVTRRWRAAAVAGAVAAAATALSAVVAPAASRQYWTGALWNTKRVGDLDFIANQSVLGALARWDPAEPSRWLWVLGALVIGGYWLIRTRQADAAGDHLTAFALTGIVGCLVSPITWIHHLVWLTPALVLLVDGVLRRGPTGHHARHGQRDGQRGRPRWVLLAALALATGVLCTRLVWRFHHNYDHPIEWFFSNGYLWLTLTLLVALPIQGRRVRAGAPPEGDTGSLAQAGSISSLRRSANSA